MGILDRAKGIFNNLNSAYQSYLDHQYAYQDAMIDAGKKNGAAGVLGLTPTNIESLADTFGLKISDGNGDEDPPKYKTPTDSAWSYSGSPVPPQQLEYINAELAKHYGMDVNTAYQEALANTAFQREVKDMKSAGLNPAVLYGGGRGGNGADSFSGRSASSGGSGGGASRRSGKSSSAKNLFSNGAYYGISTAVGIATAAITNNPANYWLGSNAAQGVLTAINSFWKNSK